VSTRHSGWNAAGQPEAPARPVRRRGAARVLVGVALWIPPALLVAMFIAGPVSASGGGPVTVAAAHVPRGHAVAGTGSKSAAVASSCAVVVLPLPSAPTAGPTGAPQGPGSCLAAANPLAPRPAAATTVQTGQSQAVTQSIGLEVRAG
jgi:hypothetical protein